MVEHDTDVTFIHALAQVRIGHLWPEAFIAAAIGLVGGGVLTFFTTITARVAVLGDTLGILGALLGVVFAAMALVVSTMSDSHIRWLNTEGGVLPFLQPFSVAIGIQVITLVLVVSYRVTATMLPAPLEKVAFAVIAWMFTWALSDIMAATRGVLSNAVLRGNDVELKDMQSRSRSTERV
jgi:hypothetical protein